MKKILFTAALLIAVFFEGMAQQDPLLTQYMFNQLLINPGYAGSKDYAMATLLYRNQWVKLDGAPKSIVATVHGPVFKSRKVGLGLTISNDKIGITNRTNIMVDYAYHIPIKNNLKLAIGIKAGLMNQSAKLSDAIIIDPTDKVYQGGNISKLVPNVGAGAYLYSKKFYLGVSVPGFLSYDNTRPLSFNGAVKDIPAYVRHYWITTGVALEVSPDFVVRPSLMFRYTKNAPLQADINVNTLIKQFLWLGATFRSGDKNAGMPEAITGIIQLQLSKQFRIGYSYDFTTTALNNYSNGSHEIMLGYDFGYDILKMRSPRYF